MARPRVLRVGVERFRSYQQADIVPDGRPACLFGPNGAGKTNLLEAISLLALGRGLRGAGLSELTRHGGSQGWRVSVRFGVAGQERILSMMLDHSADRPRRTLCLDGASISPSALSDLFALLWLAPAHDRVFSGSRSDRRRFFDRLILSHAPGHGTVSARYERAMRERNALLCQGRAGAWLDAVEERMAQAAAVIANTRVLATAKLQEAVDQMPPDAFPPALIALDGPAEALARDGAGVSDIAASIRATYLSNRARDIAAGRTTTGVHRTDFAVTHGRKNIPAALCSTGERKALLLGLVIAAAYAFLREDSGRICLLLLDDAVAHLDSERRACLYDRLATLGAQSWLSGTDPELFAAFAQRAQFFSISDSTIQPWA